MKWGCELVSRKTRLPENVIGCVCFIFYKLFYSIVGPSINETWKLKIETVDRLFYET